MQSNPRRVFLADDDEDDRLLFSDALREIGDPPHLTCVANGQEMIALLKKTTVLPDIVFLDVNMPLKDGVRCLEEIRQESRFKKLPVIMLSTSAQPRAVETTLALGAAFFIKKPDSFAGLRDILEKVLTTDLSRSEEKRSDKFLIP